MKNMEKTKLEIIGEIKYWINSQVMMKTKENISLQERLNTGYVFCSEIIDEWQAGVI